MRPGIFSVDLGQKETSSPETVHRNPMTHGSVIKIPIRENHERVFDMARFHDVSRTPHSSSFPFSFSCSFAGHGLQCKWPHSGTSRKSVMALGCDGHGLQARFRAHPLRPAPPSSSSHVQAEDGSSYGNWAVAFPGRCCRWLRSKWAGPSSFVSLADRIPAEGRRLHLNLV